MADPNATTDWAAPLLLHEDRVRPEWVDYNGHMSEAFYVLVFGYATDALLDAIGMDEDYRQRSGMSLYTLEAHIRYLREVAEGAPLSVSTHVLDADAKRVHLSHSMWHGDQGHLVATGELMLCNVDRATSRSSPFPEEVATRLGEIVDSHQRLPTEDHIGASIGMRR